MFAIKPCGSEIFGHDNDKMEVVFNKEFIEELTYFAVHRSEVRRFMPTADFFPLFFELIDAAKTFYAGLPRQQRTALKHIPFRYFGRNWFLRAQFVRVGRPNEVHLSICQVKPKTPLVTVPVLIAESWGMP